MLRKNVLFLSVAGLMVAGCAAPRRTTERSAQFTTFEASESAFHPLCPFGTPVMDVEWDHGDTTQIDREGYALLHSNELKVSLWVCEKVKKSDVSGKGDRKKSSFKAEPRLRRGDRAELSDYEGSGFDRGHQAPAADFKHSQDETDDSFFLSNMAPQVGSGFNRGIWRSLETKARKAAVKRGDVFIITGALFYDPEEENPDTADGFIEYGVIGENDVSVPTHFYKIIVDDNDGHVSAIAFVLENRKYTGRQDFSAFVREIDWIEERVGFDFMPNLEVAVQRAIEGAKSSLSDWPEFK